MLGYVLVLELFESRNEVTWSGCFAEDSRMEQLCTLTIISLVERTVMPYGKMCATCKLQSSLCATITIPGRARLILQV